MTSDTTFADSQGRPWDLTLNIGNIERIRRETRTDLSKIKDGRELLAIHDDPMLTASILWAAVEPAAKEQGVDRSSFYEALDGSALDSAFDALREAVITIAPSSTREALRKVIARTFEAHGVAMAQATKWIDDNASRLIDDVSRSATAKLDELVGGTKHGS